MYPVLTTAQIDRMALLGRERPFEVGEILFEQGVTNRPLIVVLEGEIEILSGQQTLITVHRPGNFSGEVDLIAGQPAVVRGRARLAGRILEVPAERVRSLVVTDPELSQIFLRAFMLRRARPADDVERGKRRAHRVPALYRYSDPAGIPDAQ